MHQVWRVVPHVLPVVYDADHVVTAGEQRGQVGSLGLVVETLVPRKNTVGKVSENHTQCIEIFLVMFRKKCLRISNSIEISIHLITIVLPVVIVIFNIICFGEMVYLEIFKTRLG